MPTRDRLDMSEPVKLFKALVSARTHCGSEDSFQLLVQRVIVETVWHYHKLASQGASR